MKNSQDIQDGKDEEDGNLSAPICPVGARPDRFSLALISHIAVPVPESMRMGTAAPALRALQHNFVTLYQRGLIFPQCYNHFILIPENAMPAPLDAYLVGIAADLKPRH